jgi:hypothetical protein
VSVTLTYRFLGENEVPVAGIGVRAVLVDPLTGRSPTFHTDTSDGNGDVSLAVTETAVGQQYVIGAILPDKILRWRVACPSGLDSYNFADLPGPGAEILPLPLAIGAPEDSDTVATGVTNTTVGTQGADVDGALRLWSILDPTHVGSPVTTLTGDTEGGPRVRHRYLGHIAEIVIETINYPSGAALLFDFQQAIATIAGGATTSRPANPGSKFMFWPDTTLHKLTWWDWPSSQWRDAMGNIV